MKNFKSFINEAGPNAKPKAKGEADFVDAHKVEISDPEEQGTDGSAKVTTKEGSGKRKVDRLDNKQAMGEEVEELDELEKSTLASYVKKRVKQLPKVEVGYQMAPSDSDARRIKKYQSKVNKGIGRAVDRLAKEEVELDEEQLIEMDKSGAPFTPDKPKKNPPAKAGKYGQGPSTAKHLAQMALKKQLEKMKEEVEEVEEAAYTNPGLEALAKKKKSLRQMKQGMKEADFSKQQTKMANTIGKEFEKKGVGDQYKGGPYAVASAMVRDKPESAKKAYKTIQSKMKEEADTELLFKLYNDLNEENQEFFMHQLEEDAESLLDFAKMLEE
jgi:hypothetical protein